MKISVITVSYNSEHTIEDTIKSVISQDYPNIEYIIVDGNSKDRTSEIVNKYKDKITRFVSEPDNGIYDAMNKGIRMASGDWINFMNCGDSFYSNDSISSVFANNEIAPTSKVVYGDVCLCKDKSKEIFKAVPLYKIHKCMPFCHQSCFVNRAYIKPFNLDYKIAADYDFFYHLYYSEGPNVFQYVPVVISNYESVEGLSFKSLDINMREFIHIRKEHITLHWFYTIFVYIYRYKFLKILKK